MARMAKQKPVSTEIPTKPGALGVELTDQELWELPPGTILVPVFAFFRGYDGYPRYEIGPRGGIIIVYSPQRNRTERVRGGRRELSWSVYELILEPVDITPGRRAS